MEITPQDSMYEVLQKVMKDKNVNLVRFQKARAEAQLLAHVRVLTGKTLRSEGIAHNDVSSLNMCGTKRDTLYLKIRDKSTRKEDGSFDWRTNIVAIPSAGQRVSSIEVNYNFKKGWEEIDLTNRCVFPSIPEGKERFVAQNLVRLHKLNGLKKNIESQMTRLKKKVNKMVGVTADGFSYEYIPPAEIEKVVDKDDKAISQVATDRPTFNLVPIDVKTPKRS